MRPPRNSAKGPARKDYTRDQIMTAISKTQSVTGAARYLGCSYHHVKKWFQFYKDEETGKSLLELYKNQSGKGIRKFAKYKFDEVSLVDILEGRINSTLFDPKRIKNRLLTEGFLEEKCSVCNFTERRALDYKIPLILHFKDGDKTNFGLLNLELLCYNCYFLQIGEVFTEKDIDQLETHCHLKKLSENVDFRLDEENKKLLGFPSSKSSKKDDNDLISYA